MRRRLRLTGWTILAAGLAATAGVAAKTAPPSSPPPATPANPSHTSGGPRLQPLHDFEETLRKQTDFRALPAGDKVTGPDPYLVRALPGPGHRLVSILRGAAQLVVLDSDLRVIASSPTPRAPTGLTVTREGDIFVSSEQSPELARFRVTDGGLSRTGTAIVDGVRAIRDIVDGDGGVLYAADELGGRVLSIHLGAAGPDGRMPSTVDARAVGHGPIQVYYRGGLLLVNCLLDHAVVVFRLGRGGTLDAELARVVHDGPIWSFDTETLMDGFLLAVGGVEDHPLDRTGGSFGYVDSFLTIYRVTERYPKPPVRVATTNLSALGLVTPKVVHMEPQLHGTRVRVAGYATDAMLTLTYPRAFDGEPTVSREELVPGTTSLVARDDGALVFADPLLDAWVVRVGERTRVVPVRDAFAAAPPDSREPLARVGEALLFTTLMAPWNRSDGPLSRFTCETCHFEMYGDGRTHHTGRGDVHATTKPLRGLFNNRPHFSRALDADLASVANSEFRVAGARSDHDPWFDLRVDDFPWLRWLGVGEPTLPTLPAVTLRKALMTALMRLSHAPNPNAVAAGGWTDAQRAGAALFRDRCESCHQARLVSDDGASRVPFAKWEALVMTDRDPLVWGQAEYRQTGVVPYVHENGARVPSLRRLDKKFPYFTNGSAADLDAVLGRARFSATGFWHDGAPVDAAAQSLAAAEMAAIRAFLDLL